MKKTVKNSMVFILSGLMVLTGSAAAYGDYVFEEDATLFFRRTDGESMGEEMRDIFMGSQNAGAGEILREVPKGDEVPQTGKAQEEGGTAQTGENTEESGKIGETESRPSGTDESKEKSEKSEEDKSETKRENDLPVIGESREEKGTSGNEEGGEQQKQPETGSIEDQGEASATGRSEE